MWSDENPSSGYNDTQASFGSISLVAKKLTSLSNVSSSLEEDAPAGPNRLRHATRRIANFKRPPPCSGSDASRTPQAANPR